MDWTFYTTTDRPNPFGEVWEFMRINNEHIVQVLLAGIMGVVSIGVSHIKDLTTQVQTIGIVLSETRAESTLRLTQQANVLTDHEQRIRAMEHKVKRR